MQSPKDCGFMIMISKRLEEGLHVRTLVILHLGTRWRIVSLYGCGLTQTPLACVHARDDAYCSER